jgi:cell filamentation protein
LRFLYCERANFTTIRIVELSNRHIKGNFDLAHLKAIHKYLFQDIYAWAGKIRDIDLSKSNTRE